MKTFKVLDFLNEKITKRKMHPAGYMILPDCIIARSGILRYSDVMCEDGSMVADGAAVAVYRPPEALKKCVAHFNGLPLTTNHPAENAVDPNTVKQVIVGVVGTNARIKELDNDEVAIVADIIVHDKDAIADLNNGSNEELSAGYETSYKNKRGKTQSGEAYEAIQFYLMPNHVALVESGRCGSECRVCDHDENTNSQKEKNMKVKKAARGMFRYFLAGDSASDEVTEITKTVFDQLEQQEGAEVEELDEDEVVLEESAVAENEDIIEKLEDIIEEHEEDTDDEELEEEDIEEDVDEDEELAEAGTEEIFEVELDNGKVGKMDKVAYEYFKRYMEVQKKADSGENSAASILALAATATRVLGSKFAVDSYIRNGKFSAKRLKLDVIKKQMPEIVVTSLKSDEAINNLFETAVASNLRNVTDWKADMMNLADAKQTATDQKPQSPVEIARAKRLRIINRKGE